MAYSELIKSFDRIRDYMRQFYVYGFKSRSEYDKKSARSYDNERRRIESWLGDFMRFRQTPEGKNVFLSVDSRSIPCNPFYNAFKAKSFTAGDVTFHFYILDILQDGRAHTVQEILDIIVDEYLCHFESKWQPDISTIRKKLKEYVSLGILKAEKRGRELYYSRTEDTVDLSRWENALSFYSETDPLGVIGSTLKDKTDEKSEFFQFKHHYMLHALNSQILLQLLTAIGEKRRIMLINASRHKESSSSRHYVLPLKIFISTQGGRQYLLCHHNRFQALRFFRVDYIKEIEILEEEPDFSVYERYCEKYRSHLWGTSNGMGFNVDHLEMTLHFEDNEQHIPRRLEREKRNGRVQMIDRNMLHQIFHKAEANDLIRKNPVRFAEKMRSSGGPKKRKEAFNTEEVQILMAQLPYDKMGMSIRLMLGTGMRSQELLALEPHHIEEDGSVIHIRQAVNLVKGSVHVGVPKSRDSYRDIPVPPNLRWCARELRKVDTKFIWEKRKKDTPCNPTNFRDEFREALEKIEGVRQLTPHSCRHTYVSQMQALGVDLSTIQSIVGHADVDMTQHYLHVQDGIRQEAIRRFAEAFPIDGHSPEDPDGGACRIIPFPQVV